MLNVACGPGSPGIVTVAPAVWENMKSAIGLPIASRLVTRTVSCDAPLSTTKTVPDLICFDSSLPASLRSLRLFLSAACRPSQRFRAAILFRTLGNWIEHKHGNLRFLG